MLTDLRTDISSRKGNKPLGDLWAKANTEPHYGKQKDVNRPGHNETSKEEFHGISNNLPIETPG